MNTEYGLTLRDKNIADGKSFTKYDSETVLRTEYVVINIISDTLRSDFCRIRLN